MRSIIIPVFTLCFVLGTCFTPSNSALISQDAAPIFTNVASSSLSEAPKSDSQSEVASAKKKQKAPKLKSPKAENSTDEVEGEASGPEPRPWGLSSILRKGLVLYYLVMFVVGLVAWCGRPVRKVSEERYALYYGRQDGVGEAGEGYHHG